jgi:EAL domain-containing protein (putative c-di-GMP-specific phosphodiesterase class I)
MEGVMSHDYKTRDIIDRELIQIYMQVVLSHHNAFAIGIEAFIKGIHPMSGDIIGPYALFENAKIENMDLELSVLAMKKSVEVFVPMHEKNPDSFLFLNIHESIIQNCDEVDIMKPILEEYNLFPKDITFDIGDYENVSVQQVKLFIDKYRALGYYISIDDIGKNYFNLDRIILFNPDMIKINHQYLARLNNEAYRDRVLKHIGHIAHEMGMVVVDTGIENDVELKVAFDQGAQYFQGYYIQEPMLLNTSNFEEFFQLNLSQKLLEKYAKTVVVDDMRFFMNKLVLFLGKLKEESHEWTDLNSGIAALFDLYPAIENGWIVNKEGIQISEGMINNIGFSARNANIFKISDRGHDYSGEELYRFIIGGTLDVWITKPYISLLSNSICVTTSSFIEVPDKDPLIVCLVFNYEVFRKIQ